MAQFGSPLMKLRVVMTSMPCRKKTAPARTSIAPKTVSATFKPFIISTSVCTREFAPFTLPRPDQFRHQPGALGQAVGENIFAFRVQAFAAGTQPVQQGDAQRRDEVAVRAAARAAGGNVHTDRSGNLLRACKGGFHALVIREGRAG